MLFKNKDEFISQINTYLSFVIEQFLEDLNEFNLDENETDKALNVFLILVLKNLQQRTLSENCIYDSGFIYLKEVVKSLLEEEQKKIKDFIYIYGNSKIDVYKIGSKVLKLSYPKIQQDVPKSKFNVESITDQIKVDGFTVVIDIMEYLKPLYEIRMSKKLRNDIVYRIYKGYREEGRIWADPRPENVGRLLKDNKINLNSIIYLKEKEDILRSGEYANFDVEYIYEEADFDYQYLNELIHLDDFEKMEKRYQKELKTQKN